MELILAALPETLLHYTGKPVPQWMRMMHPEAAHSVLQLEKDSGGLVYNDIWRSAEISLWAMRQKSGVQPAGYSAHGVGIAIDFAVDHTLKKLSWDYAKFVAFLETRNWFCHRRDGKRGSEDWHFNYLPFGLPAGIVDVKRAVTWASPAEARMLDLYADQMRLDPLDQQRALQKLKLYEGDVDGVLGPKSQRAEAQFREKWGLPKAGVVARYQRTLAFVTATKKMVPLIP